MGEVLGASSGHRMAFLVIVEGCWEESGETVGGGVTEET